MNLSQLVYKGIENGKKFGILLTDSNKSLNCGNLLRSKLVNKMGTVLSVTIMLVLSLGFDVAIMFFDKNNLFQMDFIKKNKNYLVFQLRLKNLEPGFAHLCKPHANKR